ncbi:MAG: hypothetical protein J2P32_03915, partial [Actinobacteria bacterium]|nr:hypothetical protein [Actinomycetota bacterium]
GEAGEVALAGEAGEARQPANAGPAGKALRRIAREKADAEQYLAGLVNQVQPPVPVAELRQRARRGDAASLLRLLLHGRPAAQLLAGELQRQRIWDAGGWQEPLAWPAQAIGDFGGVEVPAAELRAAEEAWLAEPEPVRGRWGAIDPEPVRAHVSALIAAGMDPRRVAELSGRITTVFIDGLLRRAFGQVGVDDAKSLLLIRAPGAPSDEPSG